MPTIQTLLIANRGEIACRVIRSARAAGIRTVAVYSDADANAPHVRMADDAVHIGASPVGESYLDAKKILAAAASSGADAIHPGYGFLSENAGFAKAVKKAGLVFVGPPEKAITVMGDKARSKRAMIKAGVPCVPGYQGEDQSDETLIHEAKSIGFPLMVKAAAGGGGRGMRLVEAAKDLASAIKLARSEAENAFGSGDLIIEKAIIRPRHVEIQVFADEDGNTIHLGERDCSVQRRHQKVIEEAPCPVMTPGLREEMGAAAVDAARAVDYVGAGTVEFLLGEDGAFYFLEMNTRLQVEHPVTEEITGLDLVALQLRVAAGAPLGLTQEDVTLAGHAIEVRLYAEDPETDFLPSTGPVRLFRTPTGDGVRVDAGIETGGEVSPFYDAMVAKIIAHGATRNEARRRLVAALKDTALFGPRTNRDFLIDALGQETFASGEATTAFIAETYGDAGFQSAPPSSADYALASALHHALRQRRAHASALSVNPELLDWSSTDDLESVVEYGDGETTHTLTVNVETRGKYHVTIGDAEHHVRVIDLGDDTAKLSVDGQSITIILHEESELILHIAAGARALKVTDVSGGAAAGADADSGGVIVAPMHGKLLEIAVKTGDAVKVGDKLAVLEAMKMQHEIIADIDGVVDTIAASADTQLSADDLILEIKPGETA